MNERVLPKKDDAIDQITDTSKQEIKEGQDITQTGDRQVESRDELPPAQDLETFVENDPKDAKEVLKDTPLEKEADQILDDSDKRNDEVSNIAVKKTLDLLGTRPNFHENDPAIERMQRRIDKLAEKDIEKDEDFLGPDEYIDENGNIQVDPNWKPEDADEDFAGPDELPAVQNQDYHKDLVAQNTDLAPINSNLPEEITPISVEAPSEEVPLEEPEIEYSVEETREPGKPKEVEDDSHIVGIVPPNLPKFNSKGMEFGDPENAKINPVELQRNNLSNAGISASKSVLGNIGKVTLHSAEVQNEERDAKGEPEIGSSASKAPTYDKNSPEMISKAVTSRAMRTPHDQENMFLSRGMLKGPKVGDIKSGNVILPNGESKDTNDFVPDTETDPSLLMLKAAIVKASEKWPGREYKDDSIDISVRSNGVFLNEKEIEKAKPEDIEKAKEVVNA